LRAQTSRCTRELALELLRFARQVRPDNVEVDDDAIELGRQLERGTAEIIHGLAEFDHEPSDRLWDQLWQLAGEHAAPAAAASGDQANHDSDDSDAEGRAWLGRIASLLAPCPTPDLDGGTDLCPCGSSEPWPCPATQAAWLARGIDPPAEVARILDEARATRADRLAREHTDGDHDLLGRAHPDCPSCAAGTAGENRSYIYRGIE
jgi:hypothetical protein